MARNVALVALGVVVGILGGAALGIRAADGAGGDMGDVEASEDSGTSASPAPTPEPFMVRGVWLRLAECESTSNWRAATGNGYWGGLQQDLTFWRRYGGLAYAARPDLATMEQQVMVAERGLAVQGWAAWPACSRRLGLRSRRLGLR